MAINVFKIGKKIEQLKKEGLSSQEIKQGLAAAFQSDSSTDQAEKKLKEAASPVSKFLKTAVDIGSIPSQIQTEFIKGAAKGTLSTLSNIPDISPTGSLLKQFGIETGVPEAQKQQFQQMLEAKGPIQKTGKFVEQVAEFGIPGLGPLKAGNLVTKIKALQKISPALSKILGIGTTAGLEAVSAGGIATLQEGELGQEALTIAGIAGALPIVGPIISKAFKGLRGAIGETIVKSTPKQIGADIRKGFDVGQAATDFALPAITRGQVAKRMQQRVAEFSDKLDALIAKIDKVGKGTITGESLTKNILEEIKHAEPKLFVGLGLKEKERVLAQINDKIAGFLADNPGLLKLAEQQTAKKGLGGKLGKKLEGDKVLQAGEATNEAIRSLLQKSIEQNVPGAKELNKLMAPFIRGVERIQAKGAGRGMFYDLIVGTSYAGAQGSSITSDPLGWFKDFAIGVLLRRTAATTLPKTIVTSQLRNLEKIIENRLLPGIISQL